MRITTLRCDHVTRVTGLSLPCPASIEERNTGLIRAIAVDKGWSCTRDGDFCPNHKALHERISVASKAAGTVGYEQDGEV